MLVRVGMHQIAVAVFMDVVVTRWIKHAVNMAMNLVRGVRMGGGEAEFCNPNRQRDGGEQGGEDVCTAFEAKGGDQESRQWISQPPSGHD